MKSGLSLTPIPSDTNKAGSKVTRHEEPGRTKEARSAGVSQQTTRSAFSVIMCQIMTSNTHFKPTNHLSPRSTGGLKVVSLGSENDGAGD